MLSYALWSWKSNRLNGVAIGKQNDNPEHQIKGILHCVFWRCWRWSLFSVDCLHSLPWIESYSASIEALRDQTFLPYHNSLAMVTCLYPEGLFGPLASYPARSSDRDDRSLSCRSVISGIAIWLSCSEAGVTKAPIWACSINHLPYRKMPWNILFHPVELIRHLTVRFSLSGDFCHFVKGSVIYFFFVGLYSLRHLKYKLECIRGARCFYLH